MRQDENYQKFLLKARYFEPSFSLLTPSDTLNQLERQGVKVGQIINIRDIEFKIRFLPLNNKGYAPNSSSSDANYLNNLLATTRLRLNVIWHESGHPGLSLILVTPQTVDNEVRAKYLMDAAQIHLDYINSYAARGVNPWQEAFGTMLEFNERILQLYFPNSYNHLHERLDDYEAGKSNEQALTTNFHYRH